MTDLGPYTLLDRIACGGMGEIFLASLKRDGGFEKALAVKRILPHLADNPAFVKMFEEEARLTALLNHPNIVHIYDFGSVDGSAYLAMELVDGFDLRALMELGAERDAPLPPALALMIAADCARALDYAHRRQGPDGQDLRIIHRDVSPQNVLISMEGEVKLTDFGLAKALSLDTGSLSGMLKGKLAYMSPEQIKGETLDGRTDIFALGAVLYELLSATRLYPPDAPVAALVARVTNTNFAPLTTVAPHLPPAVCALVGRCLAPMRGQRWDSAAALEKALREVAQSEDMVGAPHQLAEYMKGFASARKVIPGVAADGTVVSHKPLVSREGAVGALDATLAGAPAQALPSTRMMPRPAPSETLIEPTSAQSGDRARDEAGTQGAASQQPSADTLAVTRPAAARSPLLWVALAGAAAVALFVLNQDPARQPSKAPVVQTPDVPPPALIVLRAAERTGRGRTGRRPVEMGAVRPQTTVALSVTVTGAPEGSQCFVHDVLRDRQSPVGCAASVQVPPGPHRVLVMAPGRKPVSQDVVLKAGEPQTVALEVPALPVAPCALKVTTDPDGARVDVDGEPSGLTTPATVTLKPGPHTLVLTRSGRQVHTAAFTCDEGAPATLHAALEVAPVQLRIGGASRTLLPGRTWSHSSALNGATARFRLTATASGAKGVVDVRPYAKAILDGRALGDTPARLVLKAGRSHKLTFKRGGATLGTVTLRATTP